MLFKTYFIKNIVMALSAKIKEKFEKRIGMAINELTDSNPYNIGLVSNAGKVNHGFGRGYVNFGKSVSSKQKEKENMQILRNW